MLLVTRSVGAYPGNSTGTLVLVGLTAGATGCPWACDTAGVLAQQPINQPDNDP